LPFFEIKKLEVKEKPLRDVVPRGYPTEEQALEIVTWLKNFQGRYVDLAKIAGCQKGSIHHIKAGRTNCTLEMYKKLTKARKELEGVAA
jgi:antitoxin component HigA of HigAB toxin-antitoxin module